MTAEQLSELLGSDEIEERARGLTWAHDRGAGALPNLLAALRDPAAGVRAQVWAMIAVGVVGPAVVDDVRDVLVEKMSDPSPTVRRASIRTLMALDDVASREAIARLLTDDTLDPSAWFDDDATVAQAARSALVALDRPR